ncbi:MAG: TetR/AcrR family transcriptional regulator [Blautia sp.]|nr:TetR/AcrR family transcriptional regulator [Blautia sp.]
MGKLELNKQKKQNALYNTAFSLFTTKGISKTTISDIVEAAGVAKGTFYLYFKDKYDIRNKLIAHKAAELLREAHLQMRKKGIAGFVSQIHFLVDFMLDYLQENPALLSFLYKNLTWGIFRNLYEEKLTEDDYDFSLEYMGFLLQDDSVSYDKPELLLFTILELVSGTCYSCIVHRQPVSMAEYRPYLHKSIDGILESFSCKDG